MTKPESCHSGLPHCKSGSRRRDATNGTCIKFSRTVSLTAAICLIAVLTLAQSPKPLKTLDVDQALKDYLAKRLPVMHRLYDEDLEFRDEFSVTPFRSNRCGGVGTHDDNTNDDDLQISVSPSGKRYVGHTGSPMHNCLYIDTVAKQKHPFISPLSGGTVNANHPLYFKWAVNPVVGWVWPISDLARKVEQELATNKKSE